MSEDRGDVVPADRVRPGFEQNLNLGLFGIRGFRHSFGSSVTIKRRTKEGKFDSRSRLSTAARPENGDSDHLGVLRSALAAACPLPHRLEGCGRTAQACERFGLSYSLGTALASDLHLEIAEGSTARRGAVYRRYRRLSASRITTRTATASAARGPIIDRLKMNMAPPVPTGNVWRASERGSPLRG